MNVTGLVCPELLFQEVRVAEKPPAETTMFPEASVTCRMCGRAHTDHAILTHLPQMLGDTRNTPTSAPGLM